MKQIITVTILTLISIVGICETDTTSATIPKDKINISILTCTAGAELYSGFGHTAVRIKNQTKGTDLVFNFGTFNFNEPNFYMKFVRGKLNYFLSIEDYKHFEQGYIYEKREIREQILNLDYAQKLEFEKRLFQIYESDERYYKYDFLYNNCSTKIYELLEETYGASLSLQKRNVSKDHSFMDYIHAYLVNSPWTKLGIDISLGLPCYKTPSARELSF